MGYQAQNVQDLIFFEYAKLITVSRVGKYPTKESSKEYRKHFWGVFWATKRKLNAEAIQPSGLIRENKMLVDSERTCAYCGSDQKLQWEHVIPLSRGGPDSIDNLVLACQPCNLKKGKKDIYLMYRGHTHEIPRVVWGKYLKLIFDAHAAAGTLKNPEYPTGCTLSRSTLIQVFEANIRK